MNKLLILFSFILLPIHFLSAQNIPLGQWRDELPYQNARSIVQSVNKIYCATNVSLYTVDKSDFSIEKLSKVNGLSDIGFSTLHFDADHAQLIIAYSNSNIDILSEDDIVNISDIKRKNIVGDKNIYSIYHRENFAYLACGFGVAVLDLTKLEIADTYYPGQSTSYNRVNAFTSDATYFYAATAIGLFRASINSSNLSDYSQWENISASTSLPVANVKQLITSHQKLFCVVKDSLFEYDGAQWQNIFWRAKMNIRGIDDGGNKLVVCLNSDSGLSARVLNLFEDNSTDSLQTFFGNPQQSFIDADGKYWIADGQIGLTHYSSSTDVLQIFPSGPLSSKAADMMVYKHNVFVAPGTVTDFNYTGNSEGYFLKYDGRWYNFNRYNIGAPLDTVVDIFKTCVNPITRKIFYGSFGWGLIQLDSAGRYETTYKYNASLQSPQSDPGHVLVSGLAVDVDGNLWLSNYTAAKPFSLFTPDGNWYAFTPSSNSSAGKLTDIVIDQNNFKWIVMPNNGILVYNSGENVTGTIDDEWKTLGLGVGLGNLPTKNVQCLAVDKDGYIWVGTDQGVPVFYCPYDVFSTSGCDAQQIIVKQDLYNGYLLGTESINDIAVDGANRKWFATNNGAFLMSADGTEQLFHFTTENSPLFSNNINSIAIDDLNGDIFFGTDLGIIVYRGDAISGNETGGFSDSTFIFPNPVRENFYGVVTIKGMPYQSIVKITDLSGVLVYSTQSNGGEAVWNVKDLSGNRVNTGVYLVFASNVDGSDAMVGKIAVVK